MRRWCAAAFLVAIQSCKTDCLVQRSFRFLGHGPLVHRNNSYGPLKKKRCNKYLKLGFNHRSNGNVCKAYEPFKSHSQTPKSKSWTP